jgi:competence protein ComEC
MTLRVLIHDVGHGQAIHAFTPAGQTVVIDLGCSSAFSPLEWLSGTTKTIDSLKITHPHGDHIDEFLLLKQMGFKVRQLWRPSWLPKEEVYKQNQSSYTDKLDAYFEMSDRYTGTISDGELVGDPAVSGGVSITQFNSKTCGISNINNHSGVFVFEYLGVSIIIPGDNEPASWGELMKQPKFISAMNSANVFMASHHGRVSGYCTEIFEQKPNLCVVSDGRVQDTDARGRYSYHAKGWNVKKRNNLQSEERYCITTRRDGFIDIEVGKNTNGGAYLSVEMG